MENAPITIIDVCAYVGLLAVGLATANMLLGIAIAVRYSPFRFWPHRRINIFRIHNWTGYLTLGSVAIHPIFLLFVSRHRFRVRDLLVPIHSPLQPIENTVGAIALYVLAIVVVTSYFRRALGRHAWKLFHFLVYAMSALAFYHSVFTNPNLNTDPVDYLDGGKVFVYACLVLVSAAGTWAWRFRVRKDRRERAHHTGRYAEHPALALRPGDD